MGKHTWRERTQTKFKETCSCCIVCLWIIFLTLWNSKAIDYHHWKNHWLKGSVYIVCAGASLTVTTRTTTKKNTKKSADPQKLPGLCLGSQVLRWTLFCQWAFLIICGVTSKNSFPKKKHEQEHKFSEKKHEQEHTFSEKKHEQEHKFSEKKTRARVLQEHNFSEKTHEQEHKFSEKLAWARAQIFWKKARARAQIFWKTSTSKSTKFSEKLARAGAQIFWKKTRARAQSFFLWYSLCFFYKAF